MKRRSWSYCVAAMLAVLVASPVWGQGSGSSGSGSGSSGSGGSSGTGSSGGGTTTQPGGSVSGTRGSQPSINQPQFQNPVYVTGRILLDTGQPVPESISVALSCGIRALQVIRTDTKGYFQFSLGGGIQSNIDYSASSDAPVSIGGNSGSFPNGAGSRLGGNQSMMLTGCEVRANVPGFVPLNKTITDRADITGIELGTMHLTRIAGVTGSSISVTSLLVPGNARKEFEKGDKDFRNKHLDTATQHLEKAVTEYDKYAAAWNELGDLYATNHDVEKSRQAYQKSIAADAHYVPPYLGLADLELQHQETEAAIDTAGKALEMDPTLGVAHFIQALGNFQLNYFDAAEKSATLAEKGPHQNLQDLHALHAQLLVKMQDFPGAAAQMRAYIKEFPQGRFAEQMKKDLQQIEQSLAAAAPDAKPATAQAQIAP